MSRNQIECRTPELNGCSLFDQARRTSREPSCPSGCSGRNAVRPLAHSLGQNSYGLLHLSGDSQATQVIFTYKKQRCNDNKSANRPNQPTNKTRNNKISSPCRVSLSARQVPHTTEEGPSGQRVSYLDPEVERTIRTQSNGKPPEVKDFTDHSSEPAECRMPRNDKPNNPEGILVALRPHAAAG